MSNTMEIFNREEVLDFATNIERVNIDEFIVTFSRSGETMDVKYARRANGFVVCLDINVVGDHAFWIQAKSEATEQDQIFWQLLSDCEFRMRNAASDENAMRCRGFADILADPD